MIKHEKVSLPKNKFNKPISLFVFFVYKIYLIHFKAFLNRIVLFLLFIVGTIIYIYDESLLLSRLLIILLFFLFAFPMAIALEEYFHLIMCISRGKKNTANNLVVGYYYKNNKQIFPLYVAVDYFGKFNLIDMFYISLGGPLATILLLLILAACILFFNFNLAVITGLLIFIPMIALIPITKPIQSDGYNVKNAIEKLKIPKKYILIEVYKTVKILTTYFLSSNREFEDKFVSVSEELNIINECMNNKEFEKALVHYEKVYNVDPYNPMILNNIAWLHLNNGNKKQAKKFINRAKQISPNDVDIIDTYNKVILFSVRE